MEVRGAVAGDRREPPAKRRLVAKTIESPPGGKKDVLDEILDLDQRDARQEDSMHHPAELLVQALERALIAGARRTDERAQLIRGLLAKDGRVLPEGQAYGAPHVQ